MTTRRKTLFCLAAIVFVGGMIFFGIARRGDKRMEQAVKLRKVVIGMHDHHEIAASRRLPAPIVYAKDGNPLLSWRVTLLPYLGYDDLFRQFKMDEAWDSPHNIELLNKMPAVYSGPKGHRDNDKTRFKVFVGQGCIFEMSRKTNRFMGGGLICINGMDGTANVILLAEAGAAVPWTKPEDLPYDKDKPLPNLEGPFAAGFLVAAADGAVYWIESTISEDVLRSLIAVDDGVPGDHFNVKHVAPILTYSP